MYGTPAFSADGQRMYLTPWYKEGSKIQYGVYYSQFACGEWGTPKRLNNNVNIHGYNSIQPFIAGDSKHLYFVSNKPGGKGGDDLWMKLFTKHKNALVFKAIAPKFYE